MSKLRILDLRSLAPIIVYLKSHNKASRTELKGAGIGSQQAIYNALPLLKEYGLIEERKPTGFGRRIDIFLTPKGQKVAQCLLELEKLL